MTADKHPSQFRPALSGLGLRESGFSLIEVLVAIAIGLSILAGLVGVLSANSSSSRTNDRTSELMTNGRYALDTMKQDLREAGFRGYTWAEPSAPGALGAIGNECLSSGAVATSFVSNIRQGVWGANDSNPFSANCIPGTSYAAGNDILVVRRLGSIATPTPVANQFYFQSSYGIGQMFRGAVVPTLAGSPTPVATFPVQISVYYISPFSVSATEVPLVPALYRVTLDSTGTMTREMVASGIENLQVQYGRTTTAPATQFFNADAIGGGSSDTPTSSPGYGWDDVNSVRVWVVARSAAVEPGYSNTQTYSMGGQAVTKSDGFRRQLFSTVIQLRNTK